MLPRLTTDTPERSPVGLGFRFALAETLLERESTNAEFIEVAPENYVGAGGKRRRLLDAATERFDVVSHGLCGDFSGAAPVDDDLTLALKHFLRTHRARWYSDHLCLTHAAGAELHDLIPLPFTTEAVQRAAGRIRELQDRLDLPLAVENVSAYVRMPGAEMDEATFVKSVVEHAGCHLLLDVNNVYVNSQNFGFDPDDYIDALPLDRVVQIHVAGHHREDDGLLIDTHGAPIIDPVYELLERTLPKLPQHPPILLERDHHIPPLAELDVELKTLREIAIRSAS